IAVISCRNNVHLRTREGRAIAVPRGREDYESCCGVKIGFSADGRFLIARRGYQPGFDAFVWTVSAGRLAGGQKFPHAPSVRDFAGLPGTAQLLILAQAGGRGLGPAGAPGATLVPAESASGIQALAVSADGSRIATIEPDDIIVYRASTGAPLGRIPLR